MAIAWDDEGAAQAPEAPDLQAHVDALIQQESSGNPNEVGDSGLALGLGQMHPEVRRAYGVQPNSTPEQQRDAVNRYFTDLYNKHGNVDDALTEYHFGAPTFPSKRGTPEAQDYISKVKSHLPGGATAPAAGTSISWDDAPQMSEAPTTEPTMSPASAAETPSAAPTTPPAETPSPAEPGLDDTRGLSHEEFAARTNRGLGLPDTHWVGRYSSGAKALNDALYDFKDALRDRMTKGGTAAAAHPLTNFLQTVAPLGIPGHVLGETAFQATLDATGSPTTAAIMGMAGEFAGGFLMGPAAGGAMGIAKAPAAAPEALNEAATLASKWADAAETHAAGARQTAQEAVAAAQPSVEAGARAEAAAYPAAPVSTEASAEAAGAITGKLATEKGLAGSIYDAHLASHGADEVATTPDARQALGASLNNLKQQMGALWTGKPAEVLDGLIENVKGTEPITVSDLDSVKMQLDGLFAGQRITTRAKELWNQASSLVKAEMRSTASDSEKQWLDAADQAWAYRLVGKQMPPRALGRLAALAKKDPELFASRALGEGTSEENGLMAKSIMTELKDEPSGDALRQSVFKRLFAPDASGAVDPAAALDKFAKWDKNFRDAFSTPGFEKLMEAERQIQSEATAAPAAAEEATEAATEARKTAEAAGQIAATPPPPGMLARWTGNGIEIAAKAALLKATFGGSFSRELGGAALLGRGGMVRGVVSADKIAGLLSNSARAGIIAKMLRTPQGAPATLNLLRALARETRGEGYFAEGRQDQWKTDARAVEAAKAGAPL